MGLLAGLFDDSSFMPHGHCYLWKPGLVWLHVVSDTLIAAAYFTIPVTLVYFIRLRRDLPFSWMFALFGIFIVACGSGHVLEIWNLWHAAYWESGTIKAVTAVASVATATLLVRLVPDALALPSPEQLRLKNDQLARENADRLAAETRLEASLREKEALLNEVHHRVKNNLQVISSLLRVQAAHMVGGPGTEVLLESDNRVRSMALVHQQLYESESLSHIDFRSYLATLSRNLLDSYGADRARIDLTSEVDEIYLSVDLSIPLGLIVTELVSNALKHAFPVGTAGSIRLVLRRSGDGIELVVSDSGVGLAEHVDPHKATTMGLRLVSTLSRQIDATLAVTRGRGSRFRVAIPLKEEEVS
jgi:two-component sensor histidine kinase